MKSINEIINESKNSITLNLKEYEALMLRDFLSQFLDNDWEGFGTKEDRQNLDNVFNKLDSKIR